jgi:hypothetical protein
MPPAGSDATDFVLPDEIPMDAGHTLDQLMGRFRGVRDGLPELVKNSKDQYSRLGVMERALRQIVVIASTTERRMAVLDFAGARLNDFNGWTTWSSRFANRKEMADDIEAGNGNGGKGFMVRGASERAYLESCFEGKRTRMGFKNERASDRYKPGFGREGGVVLKDMPEANTRAALDRFLRELGTNFGQLPQPAQAAFTVRNAFTGVLLSGVVDWDCRIDKVRRLAKEVVPELLASHGQAALTIETCDVWVVVDGKIVAGPIAPVVLEPYVGFEQPREFVIPDMLPDPETGDAVDMTGGDGPRYLRLHTSARQLQVGEETRARNVIRLWNQRNNVANWPLQSLGVPLTSVSFIYGELRCPALIGEHLAGAERVHLNDTPFVRALNDWTREQVTDLAEALHKAMAASHKPQDREQAKSVLNSIRNLMRRYLDPDAPGEGDEDDRDGGSDGKQTGAKKPRKPTYYGDRIDEIVLEASRDKIALAQGTTVPLRFRCIEKQADGSTLPVRADDLVLHALPGDIITADGDLRLTAHASGETQFWLETSDGNVASNHVVCEVVAASDVNVTVPSEVLLQGQRLGLTVTFTTPSGPRSDLLIEGSIDEPSMGLIGRNARFTAGYKEGQATVRIRFAAAPQSTQATAVQIGSDRVPPPEAEGGRGGDIPDILLCGDTAPGMEDIPVDQRTLPGGEQYTTIIEDPLFPNIIWLNTQSKESMRVRRARGGSSGVGGISTKNFTHFIALKCFEVLKRLHVRQALRGRTVTEFEFMTLATIAEIECADFIDAAWELSEKLLSKSETFSDQGD